MPLLETNPVSRNASDGMQPYRIEVCDAQKAVCEPELISQWERLLLQTPHVNSLYASPSWVTALAGQADTRIRLWTVRTPTGELTGVVPVLIGGYELQFSVSLRVLAKRKLKVGRILGSLPVVVESAALHAELLTAILADIPECTGLHCDALPTDSYLWRSKSEIFRRSRGLFLHVVDGPRPWHLVELTAFDAYLKAMSSKARANVKREVRYLNEHAHGKLELRRFTAPQQAADFLRHTAAVSERSWQHRTLGPHSLIDKSNVSHFEALASRDLVCSYLLMADETPCAFVIGYRFGGVFHYAEIAFDESFAEFSPGTVLLYLILEDLHKDGGIKTLNFGIGDATYKRRFGNLQREDVGCLLMRKKISTRLLTGAHTAFNNSIDFTKRLLKRKVTK